MRTSYFTAGVVLLALALAISLPTAAQTSAPPSPDAATPQAAPPQPSQAEPSQTAPSQAAPEQTAPRTQSGAAAESNQSHAQAQTQSDEDNPLNLTEEQKAKLRPIIADENQQMDGVRNDTSLTQEQKIAKANQIRQEASPKIKAILTPEQLQKLAQMQQERAKQQQNQSAPPNDSQKPQK
jgi:hypothetical protein